MAAATQSDRKIDELQEHLFSDPGFIELLMASLNDADKQAKEVLSPALYAALPWPTTPMAYERYLRDFARWIPRQSSDPAWTKPGTDEQQEVYDRLTHFYWLINQPVGPDGRKIVQCIPWFSDWLVAYADQWGSFLDSTESFDDTVLRSFIDNAPEYRVQDSLIDGRPNNPSGWLTFNQFFARELNPGLREIADPGSNAVVTSPADCTYKADYEIADDSTIPDIKVKKTHRYASVLDLLEGSAYRGDFAGGTFVHYFLGPYSYHRFHAPVAGMVRESYAVKGMVYLEVSLKDGQFDAPDSSQGGYEFGQARGVITIDTAGSAFGDVGVVAVVPVGMAQVSSVNMTATPGNPTLKGDEFGYFLFGGSDIIVLFQKGVTESISRDASYRHYGSAIAKCLTR